MSEKPKKERKHGNNGITSALILKTIIANPKATIIVAGVLVLCIVVGFVGVNLRNSFTVKTNTTDFGLKDIGELATQAGYFTIVSVIDDSIKIRNWSVPFTSSKYIFSYDGVVKAGLDFADLSFDVDEVNHTVTVQLPATKLLSIEIKEDSLEIYDERKNIFTPLDLSDIQDSREDMLEEIKQKANEQGLLEQATENAKVLIQGFLSGHYDPNEYEYVFNAA